MGGAVFFLVLLAVALTGSDEQVTRRVLVAKRFIRYVPPAHLKNQGWFAKRKESDAWNHTENVLNEAFTTMEATHRKDLDELTDAVAGQDTPLQTQARKEKISADKNDFWSRDVAALKKLFLSRSNEFKVLKGMLGKALAAIREKNKQLSEAAAFCKELSATAAPVTPLARARSASTPAAAVLIQYAHKAVEAAHDAVTT